MRRPAFNSLLLMEGEWLCTATIILLNVAPFSQGRIWKSSSGHRVMALIPRPKGSGWEDVMRSVDAQLERLYQQARVDVAHQNHRRGQYPTLPAGCGFGGGRTEPGNYANTPHNAALIEEILANREFQLVASFIDGKQHIALYSTTPSPSFSWSSDNFSQASHLSYQSA